MLSDRNPILWLRLFRIVRDVVFDNNEHTVGVRGFEIQPPKGLASFAPTAVFHENVEMLVSPSTSLEVQVSYESLAPAAMVSNISLELTEGDLTDDQIKELLRNAERRLKGEAVPFHSQRPTDSQQK